MVYDAMHLNAAQFVEPLTTESIWEKIPTSWATVYCELLSILVFDDVTQFRDTFVEICKIHEVEWKRSKTQHHCTLGIGEIYHEPIRHIFRKLQIDHPQLKK